ncbi:hypothetical protein K1719_017465 [Acacia pycnantha]|nr:hypothetical protein K1719_017465 [Acacia pycnantha]
MLEKDIGKILEGTLSSAVDTRLKVMVFTLIYVIYLVLLGADVIVDSHEPTKKLADKVATYVEQYIEAMEKVKLKQGLKLAMSISGEGNGYLQETEFWRLYKENQPLCALVMKTAVGVVYLLACLLKPFMPSFTLEVNYLHCLGNILGNLRDALFLKENEKLDSPGYLNSFRGEDTRQGFVSHLHSTLRRNSVKTYMDDHDLERGNEISSTLLRAIEQSKISLIVFSENFASSRWTLEELVTIMSCKRTRGQLVLPIFYRISPSEVRKKRNYSAVFKKLQNLSRSGMKEKERRWTTAMVEAADLAGWESSTYRTESELVEVIAMEVMRKLKSMSHDESEGLSAPENSSPRKCLLLLHR